MKLRKFGFALIFLFLAATVSAETSSDHEPETFRRKEIKNFFTGWKGVSWEAPPERLPVDRVLEATSGDMSSYAVPNEKTSLGDANIGEIKYHFRNGKLSALDFVCAASSDNRRLLDFAVGLFGPPQLESEEGDIVSWADSLNGIYLVKKTDEPAFLRFVHSREANAGYQLRFQKKRMQNFPDGYGGLKWGDTPEMFGSNGALVDLDGDLKMSLYKKRVEDQTSYLGCEVEKVRYYFETNCGLFAIDIYFAKSASAYSLRCQASENFGNAPVIRDDEQEYLWGDEENVVGLEIYQGGGGIMSIFKKIPQHNMMPEETPYGKKWIERASSEFDGGDGTEKDPFAIASPEQLARLAVMANHGDDLNGVHFRLAADIDLWGGEWTPIGALKGFNGLLDGDGHKIFSLQIQSETHFNNLGLFGIVGANGCVRNIVLCEAAADVTKNHSGIGMIANLNRGTVTGCSVSAKINGNDNSIAGIVNFNTGLVENCSSNVVLDGRFNTGGIVAINDGLVENCSAYATITGSGAQGGVVGFNIGGVVDRCRAAGAIFGDMGKKNFAGGIVGFNNHINFGERECLIKNCDADNTVSGRFSGGVAGFSVYKNVMNCSYNEGLYKKSSPVGARPSLFASIAISIIKPLIPLFEPHAEAASKYGKPLVTTAVLILVLLCVIRHKHKKRSCKINKT